MKTKCNCWKIPMLHPFILYSYLYVIRLTQVNEMVCKLYNKFVILGRLIHLLHLVKGGFAGEGDLSGLIRLCIGTRISHCTVNTALERGRCINLNSIFLAFQWNHEFSISFDLNHNSLKCDRFVSLSTTAGNAICVLLQGSFCVCVQPMRDRRRYIVTSSLVG